MGGMDTLTKARYELKGFGIDYQPLKHKSKFIGVSILDYFCDNPKNDIAYSLLMENHKQRQHILESLIIVSALCPYDVSYSSFSYFWIDEFKSTYSKAEPITIIGAQGNKKNDFKIFIHYGCAVIDNNFINNYGLSGMEIISNATHTQDKDMRKKRARLVFDYLKDIDF